RRGIGVSTPDDLKRLVPHGLVEQFLRDVNDAHPALRTLGPGRGSADEPVRASTAAVGVVAALAILNSPDIASAAAKLQPLATKARAGGGRTIPAIMNWGAQTTPVLAGMRFAAMESILQPVNQLRYGLGASMPARPQNATQAEREMRSRTLPTIAWQAWSLRLASPHHQQRHLRLSMSV